MTPNAALGRWDRRKRPVQAMTGTAPLTRSSDPFGRHRHAAYRAINWVAKWHTAMCSELKREHFSSSRWHKEKQRPRDGNANGGALGFKANLWHAAAEFRNNVDAAEQQHVALGLIDLEEISERKKGCAPSSSPSGSRARVRTNSERMESYPATPTRAGGR